MCLANSLCNSCMKLSILVTLIYFMLLYADKYEVLNPKRAIKSTNLTGTSKGGYFTDELFYNTHGNISAMTFYFRTKHGSFDGYVEI